MKTAYIDYNALNTLAMMVQESDERFEDCQAMRNLWRAFRDEKIRLVTSGKDMETDIILWLNRQGCCITDTLRANEALDEFEKYRIVDKNHIKQWRRILLFYEQIETIPQDPERLHEGKGPDKDPLLVFFREVLCGYNKEGLLSHDIGMPGKPNTAVGQLCTKEVYNILQNCLKDLHLWYTIPLWGDLKSTEYRLNLDILTSVLKRYGMETIFEGDRGVANRILFGLLNRIVGLCKKSYGKLPVDEKHADFILKTVLQKYDYCQEERNALHIFRCAQQGISFFVTTDYNLIEQFNTRKHILSSRPELLSISLQVVNPPEMELQIIS